MEEDMKVQRLGCPKSHNQKAVVLETNSRRYGPKVHDWSLSVLLQLRSLSRCTI
jgi:hypothetical protein